jgi:hypothetical protein
MTDSFLINPWLFLLVWAIVYLADYYLTIYSARLFRTHLKEHITFEGSLELTPAFQKDVDTLNPLSRGFYIRLILSFPLLWLVWYLSVRFLGMPGFFLFIIGGLLLREAVVLLRHTRNISLARLSRQDGLTGNIAYARWLSLELSAVECFSFAVFYLILAVTFESWFFAGGAFATLLTAFRHWSYARKSLSSKLNMAA